jgi:hypothetical protein
MGIHFEDEIRTEVFIDELRAKCERYAAALKNITTMSEAASMKGAAEEALRELKKPPTQESHLFCKKHRYYSCIICDRKDGGIGPITK